MSRFLTVVLLCAAAGVTAAALTSRQALQAEVRYEKAFGDYNVVATTPSTGITTVTITNKDGSRRFATPLARVMGMFLPVADRLVIIGSEQVAIADPTTATVVDHFWSHEGETVAASPTAELIAFLPPAPRWRDESSIYLIYDVRRLPAANRMPNQYSAPDWGPMDANDYVAGWAIYPLSNSHAKLYRRSYVTREPGSPRSDVMDYGPFHTVESPLSWISDTQLAFVDHVNHVSRMVVVDVSGGVEHPRITEREIDVSSIVDSSRLQGDDNAEFVRTFREDPGRYLRAKTLARLPDRSGSTVLKIEWGDSLWVRTPETVVTLPR